MFHKILYFPIAVFVIKLSFRENSILDLKANFGRKPPPIFKGISQDNFPTRSEKSLSNKIFRKIFVTSICTRTPGRAPEERCSGSNGLLSTSLLTVQR